MKVILDGAKVHSRRGLHKYLKRTLDLPDYYGSNLDALYDCLTDLHEDTELVIVDPDTLEKRLGAYAKTLVTVLHRAGQENEYFSISVLE